MESKRVRQSHTRKGEARYQTIEVGHRFPSPIVLAAERARGTSGGFFLAAAKTIVSNKRISDFFLQDLGFFLWGSTSGRESRLHLLSNLIEFGYRTILRPRLQTNLPCDCHRVDTLLRSIKKEFAR